MARTDPGHAGGPAPEPGPGTGTAAGVPDVGDLDDALRTPTGTC